MSDEPEADLKISEAFLRFSEPLWVRETGRASQVEMERALKLAWMVWNSAVVDALQGNNTAVERMRESLADTPEVLKVCELMLRRKLSVYGNDLRIIMDYQLEDDGGQWRLQVKARSP